MLANGALDFPELHPVSADLDLAVRTPEELQGAIWQPPHKVARAIQPLAVPLHEPLAGEFVAPHVAICHTGTADVELTDHANCLFHPLRAEHVRVRVGKRPSQRNRGGARRLGKRERVGRHLVGEHAPRWSR